MKLGKTTVAEILIRDNPDRWVDDTEPGEDGKKRTAIEKAEEYVRNNKRANRATGNAFADALASPVTEEA